MIRVWGLGVAVDVDLSDSGLDEAEFRRLWSRALKPGPGSRIEVDAEVPVLVLPKVSFETATQKITRALIEQQWGELLMLHAGAVTNPSSGRTLALVAPGGTGKSTLTRLLGQSLGYVTDETVGVDPATLAVLPYMKPLTWADERGKRKREHAPDDVGLIDAALAPPGASGDGVPPQLSAIAVLRRTDGAEPSFRRLGVLEAIESVISETSSLSRLERPLHLLASVFERVGGVTLLEYGDAADVAAWCHAELMDPSLPAPEVRAAAPTGELGQHLSGRHLVPSDAVSGDSESGALPEGATSLSKDVVDFLEVDGESAVLLRSTLLRLGPVATSIVRLLHQPRTPEELAAALGEEFGEPEDGLAAAIEKQLQALREHGIVT